MLYSINNNTNTFYSYNYNSTITGQTIAMNIYSNDTFILSASTTPTFANTKYGKYTANLSGLTNNQMYTYNLSYTSSGVTITIENGLLNHNYSTFSAVTTPFSAYTRTNDTIKAYTRP